MSNLSRLHTDKIQNGKPVDATFISAELDQLINGHNDQEGQLTGHATNLENINNQAFTFNGEKTFAAGIKTNTVAERTTNAGVTLDGVLLKDGLVLPSVATAPTTPTDGSLWYQQNSQQLMTQRNGSARALLMGVTSYIHGPTPLYLNDDVVRFLSGTCAMDDTRTRLMILPANLDLSLVVSGAGGLDTGTKTADTWYFPWLCEGTSGTTLIWSLSNTAPTLPTGFTTYKRLLPLAVRTDFENKILKFVVAGWGSSSPTVFYSDVEYNAVGASATGRNVILSGGTASAFTFISSSNLVPSGARMALLGVTARSNSVYLRPFTPTTTTGYRISGVSGADITFQCWIGVTPASRNFQYYVDGSSTHIAVLGYVMQS